MASEARNNIVGLGLYMVCLVYFLVVLSVSSIVAWQFYHVEHLPHTAAHTVAIQAFYLLAIANIGGKVGKHAMLHVHIVAVQHYLGHYVTVVTEKACIALQAQVVEAAVYRAVHVQRIAVARGAGGEAAFAEYLDGFVAFAGKLAHHIAAGDGTEATWKVLRKPAIVLEYAHKGGFARADTAAEVNALAQAVTSFLKGGVCIKISYQQAKLLAVAIVQYKAWA